ncbi:NAD(P)/FAD-dependent oxidoreductase [Campylobacter sp.]|uniref:NAD(P)/FAD-dependent oxidoreductase n=1 Tax=Campylobacter sp. TaxID=205 RepID=UPI002AA8F5A5|nr:NAD(P)/FAD-dependent oxidoreductase [Campylobacter sp.]MCI6660840.1 tryptophan 7-halogenase [Campylobacter sp.]MCI7549260.1 tryptophan 7-halogenase [Campylobacter sp.]
MDSNYDVVVIGAGPSGSVCSALLHKAGVKCVVIEKEEFPRFVIGESLLPYCNHILEEAGFFEAVKTHGFQYKNGAAFSWGNEYRYFDFCDKSSKGWGTTYQVQRADFDKLLIDEAIKQGVEVHFKTTVENVEFSENGAKISLDNGKTINAKFVIDASGYGRVLPRILDLETPSCLVPRKAYFTHIQDNITEILYDRKKILITTHPVHRGVWFWLIPFSNGRCSVGVVGSAEILDARTLADLPNDEKLKHFVYEAPMLKRLLNNTAWDTPVRTINSYSKDVKKLYGDKFILLGNASEFLDPVFSSGVTIAMHSAKLASQCVSKIVKGQNVNLEEEYAKPLMGGINAFRTYVQGWYEETFQDVIYTKNENFDAKRQICSILAGYAWDTSNNFVTRSDEALAAVAKYAKM